MMGTRGGYAFFMMRFTVHKWFELEECGNGHGFGGNYRGMPLGGEVVSLAKSSSTWMHVRVFCHCTVCS